MTLHCRKVDDHTRLQDVHNDSTQPLRVPAGWQIAEGNADDIRVCGTHPWQSDFLVFADGSYYGTSSAFYPPHIGELQRRRERNYFFA